jgi:hypothetical protein
MTDLSLSDESYAHSLIAAGKVDRSSDAADGNALLGKSRDDWENYARKLGRAGDMQTRSISGRLPVREIVI